jgi:hypothetical protein
MLVKLDVKDSVAGVGSETWEGAAVAGIPRWGVGCPSTGSRRVAK